MAGTAGFGSSFLKVSGTSTTAIGGITSIKGPGMSGDDIDVSDMDSANGFKEFIPGLVDAGEVSLDLNWDKDDTTTLHGLWRATSTYRIQFGNATTSKWEFTGYLKGLENEAPHDDKISATATFKISGKPAYTA